MRLITFGEGRVGWIDGAEVAVLDAPDMRAYLERGALARVAGA